MNILTAGLTFDAFFQLLEYKSFTYSYLLADPDTKEAILIDPVIETVPRDTKIVKDLGLNLKYASNLPFWSFRSIAIYLISDILSDIMSINKFTPNVA